jgi:tight adherence protein C
MLETAAILTTALLGVLLLVLAGRYQARLESRRRLADDPAPHRATQADMRTASSLQLRLIRAGFRAPWAAPALLVASALSTLGGALACWAAWRWGIQERLLTAVVQVPGGIGEVFAPAALALPWLLLSVLALGPWLWVRRARRRRVVQLEQDLPLALELFATLSEAGLGFDAAAQRIVDSQPDARPLYRELRLYQADMLAGRTRVDSLRRLAQRNDVPALNLFCSALVQAEVQGMGIASVLRRQADDLRDRRQQRAQAFAMALPVKRLVPMVVCFLPGLFVWTLGPFFVQLFQLADAVLRTRGL